MRPFETFVVGSLPRPRWVQEVVEDRREGRLDPDAAAELLDAAVPSAVRLQERAGVDVVSDGEWRRESYVKVFSENVDGFAAGESQTWIPGAPPDMAVVAPLVQRRSDCGARGGFPAHDSRRPRRRRAPVAVHPRVADVVAGEVP